MKQVKCVITDDEPTACEGLQRYVEKVDFLSLMGVCEDTMQLNTLLQTEQPDLLFLDIEMPYLSGLELLASLAHPPHVIITSAYEQYALKGYELDVTDYLLKPISFDRFLKAVNKVHGLLQQEKWPDEANNFIFVRSDRQMHKVLFRIFWWWRGWKISLYLYGKHKAACTFYHEAYDRGSSWWSISASP